MTCVGQVEINDYCTRVLERHWPSVRRWRDITTLDPRELPAADLVCGGYPCQPFSFAGKRKGPNDDRHIWPHVLKVVEAIGPAWCLFENVAGHISMGLDSVLFDLEERGYSCQPIVIPACAIGAPHRRDRVWILAHAECHSIQGRAVVSKERQFQPVEEQLAGFLFAGAGPSIPLARTYRGGNGVPHGAHRNRACGNAVHPAIVSVIGATIMAASLES